MLDPRIPLLRERIDACHTDFTYNAKLKKRQYNELAALLERTDHRLKFYVSRDASTQRYTLSHGKIRAQIIDNDDGTWWLIIRDADEVITADLDSLLGNDTFVAFLRTVIDILSREST